MLQWRRTNLLALEAPDMTEAYEAYIIWNDFENV